MRKDRVVNRLSDVTKKVGKRIISWLVTSKVLARQRKYIYTIIEYAYWAMQSEERAKMDNETYEWDKERAETIELIKEIRSESDMLLMDESALLIYSVVKNTGKIEGDIAEVGVYKGGSAKLICEAKGERALHLFDTFQGIPSVGEVDDIFHVGQFAASLDSVTDYLKGYRNVNFYEGIFPETVEPVKNNWFSFAHLDVDTYESTLACLTFFYPRMSPGGVMISHDINYPGVRRAFSEYLENRPESIIEFLGVQALVVKIHPTE